MGRGEGKRNRGIRPVPPPIKKKEKNIHGPKKGCALKGRRVQGGLTSGKKNVTTPPGSMGEEEA